MSLRFYPRVSTHPSFVGTVDEFLETVDADFKKVEGGFKVTRRGKTYPQIQTTEDSAYYNFFDQEWDVYPEGPDKVFTLCGALIRPTTFADFFASTYGRKRRVGYRPYEGVYFAYMNPSRTYATPEAVFNAYFLEKGYACRDAVINASEGGPKEEP